MSVAENARSRARWAAAALSVVMLALAGCSAAAAPEEDEEAAKPVSYPVPDGCPSAEEFGEAYLGDPGWAEALDAAQLDGEVTVPLPVGGCAYAESKTGTATNSDSTFRRVGVWYFNLNESGKLTSGDLEAWATGAGGVNPDAESPHNFDLPDTFSGWSDSNVSVVDGESRSWGWDEEVIPAYTQGASARIEFALNADRVTALVTAAANGTEAPDLMTGIIAMRTDGSASGAVNGITLTALDPATGVTAGSRSFTFPADVSFSLAGGTAYFARQSFDPELRRVAATKSFATDGSTHAGWVTSSGEFVDVTAAFAGSGSDFSTSTTHLSPRFGADGSFYYLDQGTREVKRLGPESATALETSTSSTVSSDVDGNAFLVWPSGTILPCTACVPIVEYNTPGPFGYGATVSDWLDDNTLVCETSSDSQLTVYAPYPAGSGNPIHGGRWACGADDTDTDLLPDADRKNWNPVASPDGQTVAFISATSSGDSPAELFTVGRQGGEPAKLTTSYAFQRSEKGIVGSSNRLQLLDWR